jgi:hypothetical protein
MDHTVQAAMRLRQLGTSQTVVFFAPPEVHLSILDLRQKKDGDKVDSYDVICWLLEQTCSGIEQLQPLYYSQGYDYCRRAQATLTNPNLLCNAEQREAFLEVLRPPEQQTLRQLYGFKSKTKAAKTFASSSKQLDAFISELNSRRKGFQDNSNAVHGSALQEIEQEREIACEIQTVREVQMRLHYDPWRYPSLHKDIVLFANTGRLTAGSSGLQLAFYALNRTTTLGRKFRIIVEATTRRLYVSTEFTRTVKSLVADSRSFDEFHRPVNWIVWSSVAKVALIVTPEEAEDILQILGNIIPPSTAHLLTYAAPVTRKMLHFNDLGYYACPPLPASWKVPKWLRIELGIFAGRLYFEYDEYEDLCEILGIKEGSSHEEDAERSDRFGMDGEVDGNTGNVDFKDDNAPAEESCSKLFTKKPLSFLQEWLAVRRKGQDFAHTPMGHICKWQPHITALVDFKLLPFHAA